jgi:nucleoside-diphosphate-sugar epimerase
MKIHVTGAGGFIGKALTPSLPAAGHVLVADASEADAVIHLAGIAHRRASAEELAAVNVRLAERLARAAAKKGARFLFISTVKVHGEASAAPFTECSPMRPADEYAESKARAEEALCAIPDLAFTILRPPLVYGPGVKANFLNLMRAIARGCPLPVASIDNRRSFIYVGNLVDAILRCLDVRGTFLVSDGHAVSTAQLCRDIAEALGCPARIFPFPPSLLPQKLAGNLEMDDSAIRQVAGWRTPVARRTGLQATAEWYRSL